eukprot:gene17027-23406_t
MISMKSVPSYFVDPKTLTIFQSRFQCMIRNSSLAELEYLETHFASDYMRGHELLSHYYFLESLNPHRVYEREMADFEYVPFLMLDWRARNVNNEAHICSYQSLIKDIMNYVDYTESLITMNLKVLPRFSIASTFNLRTELGKGMPTQIRKGVVYQKVTSFVQSLSIGHYERWPQCPDLLRKSWKYVIELPYLTNVLNLRSMSSSKYSSQIIQTKQTQSSTIISIKKKYTFHFSGNFDLYGSEK